MPSSAAVYARINPELKERAESILAQLGISPSSAIQMLYSQIVLNRGLPFTPRLPERQMLSLDTLTREELEQEVMRGIDSVNAGRGISADEVDRILAEELGI
ncbi:MAG: type II toxin-antitoxin system RelB/DinJ family antitoxin [Atopobiaceae bacterium]|nr:type II toxin-antitoxin system RelB/DinJ family antitoxin [Atopobiaceae bacterium]